MSKTSIHLIMVIIGLLLAMSLNMTVRDPLVGTVELIITVVVFFLFNRIYGEDKKVESNK